jgi:hypothetical protein
MAAEDFASSRKLSRSRSCRADHLNKPDVGAATAAGDAFRLIDQGGCSLVH